MKRNRMVADWSLDTGLGGFTRRQRCPGRNAQSYCGAWWKQFLIGLAMFQSNKVAVQSFSCQRSVNSLSPIRPTILLLSSSSSSSSSSGPMSFAISEDDPEYQLLDEPLSPAAFNMDLHNLAMEDPQKAHDALQIMEQMYQSSSTEEIVAIQPDSACYTTVMEGWCYGTLEHEKFSSAHRIQELLDHMEASPHLQPNELCYILACQAWADAVTEETPTGQNAQNAQDILDRLLLQNTIIQTSDEDRRRKKIPISTKLYSIVLEGWCRRVGRVPKAMDKVLTLLTDMEQASLSNHTDGLPRPNVITYTSVIGGLARTQRHEIGQQALDLLARMRRFGVEPDMVAYTSVLNCWAKTPGKEERQGAHTQVLKIIQEMEDLYLSTKDCGVDDNPRYDVRPTSITYSIAIKAIGNSFAPDAPDLAETLLNHMYNLTKSGTINIPPTVATYNALIMSLSSGRANSNWNRLTRAKRAEYWLMEMIDRTNQGEVGIAPNVRTWGAVMKAWADSGRPDAGEQAQRILDLMEDWSQKGDGTVRPNSICYTTVMNAWARGTSTSSWDALKRVNDILKRMEDVFAETGDPNVRPTKITYVTAMDAYSRKSRKAKAAAKSQALVDRMVRLYARDQGYVRPTRIIFNALINAYSKSDEPSAAAQAENIFRWMESQYQAGDDYLRPDEMTICGVLNAWANHATNGGAARAQQILDRIEQLSEEERGFALSIICYNILIKAWGRSREPSSIQKALAILNHLEELSHIATQNGDDGIIRPDVTTYSSVINCCAYYVGDEAGRREALNVALETLNKIRNDKYCDDGPNMVTFGTLFKAIAKLMPVGEKRDELVATLFAQCREMGQVGTFVLSQVKSASTTELFNELILIPTNLTIEDENNFDKIARLMPQEWGQAIAHWDYPA